MPEYTTNVGDLLVIWITGMLPPYIAEVTQADPQNPLYPIEIKVEETGPFAHLRHDDFVILERETEQLQKDCREDTNVFLESERNAGRKVISGLKKMGVTDDQLHEILPG